MEHASELPARPVSVAEAIATFPPQFSADWEYIEVNPVVIAMVSGVDLPHLLRLLICTGGDPFYIGLGFVGEWLPQDGFLRVTRVH